MSFPELRCGYCNASRPSIEMTEVPRRGSENREIWYRVLGDDFKEYCNERLVSHICLTHFKEVVNGRRPHKAIPTALPFCNENVMRSVAMMTGNINPIPILLCYNCGVSYKDENPNPTSTLTIFFCNACYRIPTIESPYYYVNVVPHFIPVYTPIAVPNSNEQNPDENEDKDVQIIEHRS